MSTYDNYFKKLNFQSVADSIEQMKQNETEKLLNPLEKQYDKTQQDINNLTATTSNESTTFGTITSVAEGLGVSIGGKNALKLVGKGIKNAISKAKAKKIKGDEDKGDEAEDEDVGVEPTVNETPLEPTTTTDEFGQTMPSTEPSGFGSGDIEMTDMSGFSSNRSMDPESKTEVPDGENPDEFAYSSDNPGVPQQNPELAESDPAEGQNLAETADGELDNLGDEATTVADDTAEITGEVAGEVAADAADVGVEAGLDTAAAVAEANSADTFGISAIVGGVLAIAGAVVGIVGATDESQNEDEIARLIALLHQSGIDFKGFYNHNGLTYYEDNREAIKQLHHGNVQKMLTLRSQIAPDTLLIMGDTPGFSVCDDFNGIDFVSAGNYVFYDFMQYSIGSCALNDIAVYMVCPIIEKRAVESTLILHGGAIHFSKDSMQHRGFNTFGQPAILKNDERFELIDGYLSGLSQEHGLLKLLPEEFKNYEIGDSIVILPVHSCLTADSMDSYLDTRGEPIAMM